jgi:hypothetical protein
VPRLFLVETDDEGKETRRVECWPNPLTQEEADAVWEAEQNNYASLTPKDFV